MRINNINSTGNDALDVLLIVAVIVVVIVYCYCHTSCMCSQSHRRHHKQLSHTPHR